MSKQIDKIEFWKDRIDTAQKEYYSVYATSEGDWNRINTAHYEYLKDIIGDKKVLDAGCAYGRWAYLFNDYIGVDFSPDFIAKAKEKNPNKKFVKANLKNLPFKDKQFDWAFCISIKAMVVNNLGKEEWDMMESELKRVAQKVLILEYEDPKQIEIL